MAVRTFGPVGEVAAGGQGVGVLGADYRSLTRQQRGELVADRGRIPPPARSKRRGRRERPGCGVLGAEHPTAGIDDLLLKGPRRCVVAALPQEFGHPCHGGTVSWMCHLYVGRSAVHIGQGSGCSVSAGTVSVDQ